MVVLLLQRHGYMRILLVACSLYCLGAGKQTSIPYALHTRAVPVERAISSP
jgi:hypothetical protein